MGVDADAVSMLALADASGVDFSSTVMLGAQTWFVTADAMSRVLADFGRAVSVDAAQEIRSRHMASPAIRAEATGIFEYFGATSVDAVDISDFEGASLIHDLNEPLPGDLHGRYSFVFDGGTLEHVFDVRTALDNMMRLVAPGGHLMSVVPANNQMGHGFYQFAPELFFRVFSPENGFEVAYLLLRDTGIPASWYLITDPAETGRRLTLSTAGETTMFVLARRIGDAGLHALPFQSDYAARWAQHAEAGDGGGEAVAAPSMARRLIGRLPIDRRLQMRAMQLGRQLKVRYGSIATTPGVRKVEPADLAAARR